MGGTSKRQEGPSVATALLGGLSITMTSSCHGGHIAPCLLHSGLGMLTLSPLTVLGALHTLVAP